MKSEYFIDKVGKKEIMVFSDPQFLIFLGLVGAWAFVSLLGYKSSK